MCYGIQSTRYCVFVVKAAGTKSRTHNKLQRAAPTSKAKSLEYRVRVARFDIQIPYAWHVNDMFINLFSLSIFIYVNFN